jgi:hypothetical protein
MPGAEEDQVRTMNQQSRLISDDRYYTSAHQGGIEDDEILEYEERKDKV